MSNVKKIAEKHILLHKESSIDLILNDLRQIKKTRNVSECVKDKKIHKGTLLLRNILEKK